MKPIIQDAPGHIVRRVGRKWEVRWQARTDLINKGFLPKSERLWIGDAPSETERRQISDLCRRLQDEMLIFGRGGLPEATEYVFDGSLKSLINLYQTDHDSRHHKKQYAVRKNHDTLYRRLMDEHGHEQLADIKARVIIAWNDEWTSGGVKLATGDAFRGRLRELASFGATILEDPDCERICGVMSKMRFENSKPRTATLKAEQAIAHRTMARSLGWKSMALADAMQFDLTLRQKDVIGELVPLTEPGLSDVHFEGKKWVKGARWEEIDEHFVFRHVTSKRGKPIEADLHHAPMVLEEFSLIAGVPIVALRRDMLPAWGPMIMSETKARPWKAQSFRQRWRRVADLAGLPKDVRSMDARAGAITEATDAGASLEDVRHAATHSDISMTQRYSRGSAEKVANVMKLRVVHRTKTNPERK